MSRRLEAGTFSIFPSSICYGRPMSEQVVLAWIWFHKNQETNKCFPSISLLCKECCCSRNTVKSAIESLVNSGILEKSERKRDDGSQCSNEYECIITPLSIREGEGSTIDRGVGQPLAGEGSTIGHLEQDEQNQKNLNIAKRSHSEQASQSPTPPDCAAPSPTGNPYMALTLAITGKDTPQPPLGVPGAKPPAAGPSKAPAAPVVPRQTWMTAYAEVWERATNGSPMPFHVAVKAFKALEKTFGRDRLIEAWTTYCRTTDKVYLSVTSFSSKAGVYMRVPNATASTGRAREYVTAEDAKRFISSR